MKQPTATTTATALLLIASGMSAMFDTATAATTSSRTGLRRAAPRKSSYFGDATPAVAASASASSSSSSTSTVTTSSSSSGDSHRLRSLDAPYVIHENNQIIVDGPAHITAQGRLSIEGDHSSLHTTSSMSIDGLLYFEFGTNVRRTAPILVDDELRIDAATARISIEASSYHGAEGLFELIHFRNGHVGEFDPSHILILGLQDSLAAEVICTESSLSLMIHPNPKYYSSVESNNVDGEEEEDAIEYMFKEETTDQDTHVRYYSIS